MATVSAGLGPTESDYHGILVFVGQGVNVGAGEAGDVRVNVGIGENVGEGSEVEVNAGEGEMIGVEVTVPVRLSKPKAMKEARTVRTASPANPPSTHGTQPPIRAFFSGLKSAGTEIKMTVMLS